MTVKICLSATDFPIKSVKVFSCGEAEVTRTFPLDLTNCPNESLVIEISKLPVLLGALLPFVTTGSDDLLVMDYYYSGGPKSFSTGPPDVNSDILRGLNVKRTSLEDERQLRQKSFAFLSTYMDSLAQGKVSASEKEPAQLVTFFDEFVELGKSRSETIAVLDQQISDIQKEIREEIKRLQHECSSLTTTATIVLACVPGHTVNTTDLELVYRVKATWKPVYEVHVTTIDGDPSSSVLLNYRCQISQSTGEDWDDVELAVTTAKPDVPLSGLPEPKKMELVQRLSQPNIFHQSEVRTGVTPFWNTPGQASAFSSILSLPQHMAPTSGPGGQFGSTHGATSSQDATGATQGLPPAANPPIGGAILSPNAGEAPPGFSDVFTRRQPRRYFQGSGPASQGFSEPALAQSIFGAPTSSLFGSSPMQSRVGGLFGSALPSPQSEASLSRTVDFPPLRPSSSVRILPVGPPKNVQHPQTSPAPPSHHQNEGIVSDELEKDVTHTATAKVSIATHVEAHHVLMATIPLKATFTRVAVPAVDARVFYACKLINTSNYVLTSGPVHTYLDGRHVSDSEITNNVLPQIIECFLGFDPAVTTEIERRIIDSEIASLPATDERKTHVIVITVKNAHEGPIDDIVIRVSLPVPQNPHITLSLREPLGLAMIDSGAEVLLRDKCSAKWSTTGKRTGRKGGVFEWVCYDVQSGSLELKAAWDVNAPRDFTVVEK